MEFKKDHIKRINKFVIVITLTAGLLTLLFFSILSGASFSQSPSYIRITNHIRFRIDNSFSPTQKKYIEGAFKRWECATNNYIHFDYYYDNISIKEFLTWREDRKSTIYNAISFFSWARHVAFFLARSNGVLGITFGSNDIFVVDNLGKRLNMVITHELGHILLGPYHSSNPHSIMYPTVGLDYKERSIMPEEIQMIKLFVRKEK